MKIEHAINEIQISLTVSQAVAVSLMGTTAPTLRSWEQFNPDLSGERKNATTVRYTLYNIAEFSRRLSIPLNARAAKKLNWPLHYFIGFYSPMAIADPLFAALDPASRDDAVFASLAIVEQLRLIAEGRTRELPANIRAALSSAFHEAPAKIHCIASILAELNPK